jgi:putative ABC transport system permease protein
MKNKTDFKIDQWLEQFCEPYLYEGIRGDLDELYSIETNKKGQRIAKLLYYLRALGFFRLTFFKKTQKLNSNFTTMTQHYLTVTLRNLKKHKAYSIINILGLTIGMTAGFMILQYVYYESTYDQFFENKENIYRVRTDRFENGRIATQWASGASGAGIAMKEEFPEVLDYVKLCHFGDLLVRDRNYFDFEYGFFATANFFQTFSIPLIAGNDSTALKDLNKIALSETMAKKIFGDQDPMGQEIQTNNGNRFTVSGVFKDLPEKTHLAADVLVSMETRLSWMGEDADSGNRAWDWDGWTNYIVLQNGSSLQALEAKFPAFVKKNLSPDVNESEYVARTKYVLQPLEDIHLTSHYRGEIKETGDGTAVNFLFVIGLFVLFIAWINYINLTTARSLNRAKEVGIRKVLGSHRVQLVRQFLFESAFTNVLAVVLSTILVILVFPYFNGFVEKSQPYTWPDANWFWLGLTALLVMGTVVSGFYPAIILSGFQPVTVLKGKFSSSSKGGTMRKGLVITQFLASIILITGTYIVYEQMAFLRNQKLGVDLEQTLVIESNRHYLDSVNRPPYQVFKNLVLKESEVKGITTSTTVPGGSPSWNAGGVRLIHQTPEEGTQYRVIAMDDQYIDLFDLEVVAGRGFDRTYGNEYDDILCNESAVKQFGLSDPESILNQKVYFWGDTFNVIGVIKNYRQESPKADFDALIFRYTDAPRNYYSVKVSSSNMPSTIHKLEAHWRQAFGEKPFNFFFADDHYNTQYKAEMRFGSIFGMFSGLAIFVACLGLFGLASYMTSLRIKEISIRKVLGATFGQLWVLLSKDFVKLVALAILISIVPTWFIMNNWLDNFANRIDLSWWLFLIPAIILFVIAISTVSYHIFTTVSTNPADTLNDE